MIEQQNYLAWTAHERHRWQRHQRIVGMTMFLTGILLFVLLFQLWRAIET
jgi:hypothetical protein